MSLHAHNVPAVSEETLRVAHAAFHKAIQAARQRQETAAFTAEDTRWAGMKGMHAQGVRRGGLRWALDSGLAKPPLQHLITAVILHVARLAEWWLDMAPAKTRRAPLAAL